MGIISKLTKMKKTLLLLFLTMGLHAQAQTRMRDVFANAPDSIFPLLTKNNRLDCIDFRENNMQARITNRLEEHSELLTLTDTYLLMQMTRVSTLQMKLVNDSTCCLVTTVKGPAEDSHVRFYDTRWNHIPSPLNRPQAKDFLDENIDTDTRNLLEALTFIKATLSPETNELTWTLQLDELPQDMKKKAEGKVHVITVQL